MSRFGLSAKSLDMITSELTKLKEITHAAIFGSRAKENYKNGSDVDLVIYGAEVTAETTHHLSTQLNEELPLPYYFDVLHFEGKKEAVRSANLPAS